jgi:hypothetical protein
MNRNNGAELYLSNYVVSVLIGSYEGGCERTMIVRLGVDVRT